jgi:hypothetical protein
VNQEPFAPTTRRRTFILAGLGAAALALAGLRWLPRKAAIGKSPHEHTVATLLAFTGAMYGHDLAEHPESAADLSDRLEIFTVAEDWPRDCAVFAQYVDELAVKQGATSFIASSAPQREASVAQVMAIEPKSLTARVLSRLSPAMREHYRMRSMTVPMLQWIYRHSAAPWRIRGYSRWPGVAGDWRESLSPGTPYP